jgi:hypothetical protein
MKNTTNLEGKKHNSKQQNHSFSSLVPSRQFKVLNTPLNTFSNSWFSSSSATWACNQSGGIRMVWIFGVGSVPTSVRAPVGLPVPS